MYRDVGLSGGAGTNTRTGWHILDGRLTNGDTLVVVAIDRIGHRWIATVNAIAGRRSRGVKSVPGVIGGVLGFLPRLLPGHPRGVSWSRAAGLHGLVDQQQLEATRHRTIAGLLARVRSEGEALGPPQRVNDDQIEVMANKAIATAQ